MEQTLGQKVWARTEDAARRRWSVRRWGLPVIAGLAVLRLCCPFSIGVVEGHSMTPTYQPGQLFLLDRHYYQSHPLRRGDVVVVRCDDHTIIKRVYGLAGDSIWLLIQTDGSKIERYIVDPLMVPRIQRCMAHWDIGRLTHMKVPPGTVYLLGDCTEASIDSRSFGAVPTSAILGAVRPRRPDIQPAVPAKVNRVRGGRIPSRS